MFDGSLFLVLAGHRLLGDTQWVLSKYIQDLWASFLKHLVNNPILPQFCSRKVSILNPSHSTWARDVTGCAAVTCSEASLQRVLSAHLIQRETVGAGQASHSSSSTPTQIAHLQGTENLEHAAEAHSPKGLFKLFETTALNPLEDTVRWKAPEDNVKRYMQFIA